MLKLYGFSVSNYYNMVKLALLEKGLRSKKSPSMAAQTQALAISPRGKVPVLVSMPALSTKPRDPRIHRADPERHAAAAERSIRASAGVGAAKEIELYIELPGAPVMPRRSSA
jgi:glutathione S-transferase